MTDLRVAIFTGNYNHIRDGVSLTLNRLVAYLQEQGVAVIIFGPTIDEPALDHKGEFFSVPSMPIPNRPEYRVSISFSNSARKRLQAFNPNLLHIATPDLLGYKALRWAKDNDKRMVASYHTHFTSYLKYYNLGMLEGLGWKYLGWFYEQCKQIYVPSPSMAHELKAKGIDEGLRIWARGVNTDEFHPDKRDMEWRRSVGFEDADKVVSFVSRLVWEKNIQTYVDTIRQLKQNHDHIKAMIVGDGPAKEELEKMLPDAHFTGFVTDDKLTRAYASSDIFFFPSETETFGNVTLEAMSSGLPCLVADATGSRSLVESGVNGYLAEPYDTEVFVSRISELAEDGLLWKKMSRKARQKALDYSWENVNRKLLENYREVLSEPRL